MDQKEKISVVVPIYNVEEYLPRCLDSIIGQTYTNIEIMLVDDGSPDNAGAICDSYAEKESRIRVFHIPNGGVAKARQLGVENSTGEYIVFVDPDDWLPLDSIATLYSAMTPAINIAIGSFTIFGAKQSTMIYDNVVISAKDYIEYLLLRKIYYGPWGKLYRKCIFTEFQFPDFKRAQDMLMNILISLQNSKEISIISHNVYNYTVRENSTTVSSVKNYEYEKLIISTVNSYFDNYRLRDKFANELKQYYLSRLTEVILDGQKCNYSDPWVKEIYKNSDFTGKSLKLKLIREALKYQFLQSLIYRLKKILAR